MVVLFVQITQSHRELKRLYEKAIYTDAWDSFIAVFKSDNHIVGKDGTKGIEGNNCRLRHRIRRDFRKTCCFSKKLFNHFRAFELAFFYINYSFV